MRAAAWLVGLTMACGGAAGPPPTTPGGGGVGNHDDGGPGPDLDEVMTEADFRDVLASGLLRRVELESSDFDPLGDIVSGRVMARGDHQLTVEDCGWPHIEFYADESGELYAVDAGHAEGVDVGLFEKRMMPRCGTYVFDLPATLQFAFKIDVRASASGGDDA